MMNYKVVIPTAGLGSRLKNLSKNINKSLVSIANKPSISYIIEKFPENIEFVIPLGYKKYTVRDFLRLAYPERKFTFVEVSPYEGHGSGLGLTLLSCKDHLQCAFIFCSNDTIVLENIPEPQFNWMGYAELENQEQYRSIRFENNRVIDICSKGATGNVKPYIGLAGVCDYKIFWDSMDSGVSRGSIETGESYGMRALLRNGIKPINYTWYDTGNLEALEKSRTFFQSQADDSPNILEKEDEAIWFVGDKVIKFHVDDNFIANRVRRASFLEHYIPCLTSHSTNMYTYKRIEGEILSKNPTLPKFKSFLDWMTGFWIKKDLNEYEKNEFYEDCLSFYRDKTNKRVEQYFKRFELLDDREVVNGQSLPPLNEIFSKIDWKDISEGVPVRFHGDLHFENILICDSGKESFALLDWRQDFNGRLEYGDIYYDFAKLLHGLIISHELICKEHYFVNRKLNEISYDFYRKNSLVECQEYFREYIRKHGFDWNKVEILTALIFLNISPLHHYPYTHLLFSLGKNLLYKKISDEN
jgi:choline kinase